MRASTLERAFEFAESGKYVSVAEIRSRLSAEGYRTAQVCGSSLNKQLVDIIAKARLARLVSFVDHPRGRRPRARPAQ